ncbi:MAG TPA: serine protease [Hyphomicrobiales bacterium]|nr:serine protease [Hyphomicrobiales bacterium]
MSAVLAARLTLRVWLLLLLWSLVPARACVNPATLAHSTVGITLHSSEQLRKQDPAAATGVRGTAWFTSPTILVTAAHVIESLHLVASEWTEAELLDGTDVQQRYVRLHHFAGPLAERLAFFELQASFPAAKPLQLRREQLNAGERVFSLAYPHNRQRFAEGRFLSYGDDDNAAGMALLEMYDGNDRLVLDHGASGAPVVDCDGRVVAVVSNIYARTITLISRPIRISTAWGSANIAAIPVSALAEQ